MRFIEIPALITEDIEDPSIVDITEEISVSISGTTMTIDGGSKVSGEATVTLTGDTTVNAFTLQNIKHPSLHKISVKTGRKGNFTYVPNDTVTASSVSTTTKTGSDFEILLITTNGGETYVDFDMADYTSPALYTSNALTGFDISELTSTYGATAKLYKPDGTLLTTVNSATTGGGIGFGSGVESIPGDVTYTLEVTDDLGRKSRYDLPRKWINYAMGTTSTPGFQKFRLEGIDDDYTTTVMFPSLGSSSTAKVYRTSDHGYLGINFKIQGRNSTGDDWVDIANADEDDEVLAFGDFLYHRVWVKPTAKATTTVSSSNVVTLTLSNLTEENVTTSFTGVDPFDINESTNTYVFEETTKIGTVPFTVTLGTETYTNAVSATTEGTAYDYVTLAFANPTLSLTTSNVTISSAKLYRDDVLFHTYGTESNVVLRSDQTGTYQAVVNDVYYSNRVTPDFTTTRSVSAPQLEFDGYNKLTFFKETLIQNNVIVTDTRTGGAWGCHLNIDANYTGEGYQWKLHKDDSSHSLVPDHDFDDDSAHGIYRYLRYTGTEDLGSWTFYNVNTDDSQGSQDTVLKIYSSNGSNEVTNAGIGSTLWVWSWNMSFSGHLTKSIFTPTSTTLGLPDGTTRDLTTQSNVYIYEPGTYTANVQTSETFAYLSNVATIQTVTQPTLVNTIPITAGDFSGYNYQHEATDTTNTYYEYNMSLNSTGSTYFIAYNWTTKKWFDTNPTDANNTFGISATDTAATSRETTENPKVVYVIGTNNGQIVLESQFINPYFTGPSLTFDGFNKLTIENLTQTSSTLKYGSNTYDTNTASNVYVTDAGEYKLEARDANTFVMSNVYVGAVDTTTFTLAFHHGTFNVSDYSSAYSSITAAATAGFVYSDTATGTYTWGTLNSVDTSTTGQTGYSWTPPSVITADVLMVAGGGGGSDSNGGGGGAGGLVYNASQNLSGTKTIVVGAGGTKGIDWHDTGTFAEPGGNTSFSGLETAIGGGAGTQYTNYQDSGTRRNGGSGGGAAGSSDNNLDAGGTGISGQGYAGGGGIRYSGGGGGGAGGAGGDGVYGGNSGNGGIGLDYSSIFGTTYGESGWFAGGGAGGEGGDTGTGGQGGGGDGGSSPLAGQSHTGGGGGGGTGEDGGSGIVLIKKLGPVNPPTLTFDGYNKLTIDNVDTVETATIKKDGAAFATTTSNTVYIRDTGTYTAEVKGSGAYAIELSKVVGAVSTGVIANPVFTSTTAITTDTNWTSGSGWEVTVDSTNNSTDRPGWKAFDNTWETSNEQNIWHSAETATSTSSPKWLKIKYPSAYKAIQYSIQIRDLSYPRYPKTWKFQGSNNDSDWTDLDTQTNKTDWAGNNTVMFTFSNSTAYQYYRLYITATDTSDNDAGCSIRELKVYTLATGSQVGNVPLPDYTYPNTITVDSALSGTSIIIANDSHQVSGGKWYTLNHSTYIGNRFIFWDNAIGYWSYFDTQGNRPDSSWDNPGGPPGRFFMETDGDLKLFHGSNGSTIMHIKPNSSSNPWPRISTPSLTYDNYNKITLENMNYEDTATVSDPNGSIHEIGTAKTMYVKDTGEYVFKISGTDKYVESNVYVSSVDLAGAPTKPISFDGYNKLTLIDAGSNVSANVTYFSNTYELGSANVLYINGTGTYDLEMSGSNVFALSSNVVGTVSQHPTDVVPSLTFDGYNKLTLENFTRTDIEGSPQPSSSQSLWSVYNPSLQSWGYFFYENDPNASTGVGWVDAIIEAPHYALPQNPVAGDRVNFYNESNNQMLYGFDFPTNFTQNGTESFTIFENPDSYDGTAYVWNIPDPTFRCIVGYSGVFRTAKLTDPNGDTYSLGHTQNDIYIEDTGEYILEVTNSDQSAVVAKNIGTISTPTESATPSTVTVTVREGTDNTGTIITSTSGELSDTIGPTTTPEGTYLYWLPGYYEVLYDTSTTPNKVKDKLGSTYTDRITSWEWGTTKYEYTIWGPGYYHITLEWTQPIRYPRLTYDTYNKLSIENLTPISTSLRLGSNTYEIGTASNVYIEHAGTYKFATGDANTFALVSNVVGAIATGKFDPLDTTSDYSILGSAFTPSTTSDTQSKTSLSNDGTRVLVDNDTGYFIQVYEYSSGSWTQLGSDINYGTSSTSSRISGDGNRVCVGISSSNQVKVYEYSSGSWSQIGTTITGSNGFGTDTSLNYDGTRLMVGASGDYNTRGNQTVWQESGGNWTQLGSTLYCNHNSYPHSLCGGNVDINNDGTVVCAGGYKGHSQDKGCLHVWKYNGSSWTQSFFSEGGNDHHSNYCRLSGDGKVVMYSHDRWNEPRGRVNFYENTSGASWSQIGGYLEDKKLGDLSNDGKTVVVGKSDASIDSQVYRFDGSAWVQLGSNLEHTSTTLSISSDGSTVAIGNSTSGANKVSVYKGTTPSPSLTYDTSNKLSIENLTPTSTTLTDPNGSSFDIGTASNVYIRDSGKYSIASKDANTFLLASNTVTGTPTGTTYVYDSNTFTTPSQTYDTTKTITVKDIPTDVTGKIYKGATAYPIHTTTSSSNVIIKNTGTYVSVFTTATQAFLTNAIGVTTQPTTTSDDNTIEDEGFIPGSTAVPDETTTDAPSVTLDATDTTVTDPTLDLDFTTTLPRTLKRYNGVTNSSIGARFNRHETNKKRIEKSINTDTFSMELTANNASSPTTLTVTVSNSKFVINDDETPTLGFIRGETYTFDQSDASNSGHPLVLATSADGTQYTTGWTTTPSSDYIPGVSGAQGTFIVPYDVPDTIYYKCTNHAGMGGEIHTTFGNTFSLGEFTVAANTHVSGEYTLATNYDGTTSNLYVNGSLITQTTPSPAISAGVKDFILGKEFDGYVKNFKFWNYAKHFILFTNPNFTGEGVLNSFSGVTLEYVNTTGVYANYIWKTSSGNIVTDSGVKFNVVERRWYDVRTGDETDANNKPYHFEIRQGNASSVDASGGTASNPSGVCINGNLVIFRGINDDNDWLNSIYMSGIV
jgi:hypothetical protein